ncbi:hypothetical protein F2981_33890 (plasmid) [Sinorhizobium meliloti]|nr:hypothetical protein [Sinorhizobium meliloti]
MAREVEDKVPHLFKSDEAPGKLLKQMTGSNCSRDWKFRERPQAMTISEQAAPASADGTESISEAA